MRSIIKIVAGISFAFMFMFPMLCINVSAYDCEEYKIDIPEKYQYFSEDSNALWINAETADNILASVTANYSNANLQKATQEDIDSIKREMTSMMQIRMLVDSTYDSFSILSSEARLDKINNYDALIIDIVDKLSSENIGEMICYQRVYLFTTRNYIYNFAFTYTSEEVFNSGEMETIMNTFKAKDKEFVSTATENTNSITKTNDTNNTLDNAEIVGLTISIAVAVIIILIIILSSRNKRNKSINDDMYFN